MNKKKITKVSVYGETTIKPLEPIEIEPSNGLKEAIFEELQRFEKAKLDARREPHHTMYNELQKQLSKVLNELYKEGKIQVGQGVNEKYILTNRTVAKGNE